MNIIDYITNQLQKRKLNRGPQSKFFQAVGEFIREKRCGNFSVETPNQNVHLDARTIPIDKATQQDRHSESGKCAWPSANEESPHNKIPL
jgi:hypothetical protein